MTADRYVIGPAARALQLDVGISPVNVLRRAALPADTSTRAPLTMSPDEYHALWMALEEEAGEQNLPIAIARALRTGSTSAWRSKPIRPR